MEADVPESVEKVRTKEVKQHDGRKTPCATSSAVPPPQTVRAKELISARAGLIRPVQSSTTLKDAPPSGGTMMMHRDLRDEGADCGCAPMHAQPLPPSHLSHARQSEHKYAASQTTACKLPHATSAEERSATQVTTSTDAPFQGGVGKHQDNGEHAAHVAQQAADYATMNTRVPTHGTACAVDACQTRSASHALVSECNVAGADPSGHARPNAYQRFASARNSVALEQDDENGTGAKDQGQEAPRVDDSPQSADIAAAGAGAVVQSGRARVQQQANVCVGAVSYTHLTPADE